MKTTKEELATGIELLIRESKRIAAQLSEGEWANAQDSDGWKNKEILAHIAGVGSIVVPFMQQFAGASQGQDLGAGLDIDTLNAGLVGARAGKSIPELVQEIETGLTGAAQFARSQPDEFWEQRRTMLGYKDTTLVDLGMRMVVLHGLSHIYEAYSAVAFGERVPA